MDLTNDASPSHMAFTKGSTTLRRQQCSAQDNKTAALGLYSIVLYLNVFLHDRGA